MAEKGASHTGLTAETANTIASSSVVIDLNNSTGQALNSTRSGGSSADQFAAALQVGTGDPVEVRSVDQTTYVRADIPTLFAALGQSPAKAAGIEKTLQGAATVVPGLAALAAGQWVSVPSSSLAPLLKGQASSQPAGAAGSSQKLMDELRAAFTSNATYAEKGTQGGRTEYQVSVAARDFVQQAGAALSPVISSLPAASNVSRTVSGLGNKIPADQRVVGDVWVSNGKADEIDIDLNQFGGQAGSALPLRIKIGSATPVAAPSGATPLDLSKVPGLLGGALGAGLTSSSM
jgi:hypothetical protein